MHSKEVVHGGTTLNYDMTVPEICLSDQTESDSETVFGSFGQVSECLQLSYFPLTQPSFLFCKFVYVTGASHVII